MKKVMLILSAFGIFFILMGCLIGVGMVLLADGDLEGVSPFFVIPVMLVIPGICPLVGVLVYHIQKKQKK